MKIHWRKTDLDEWKVGIFQLGGDPVFRVVERRGTWYVFPPTDPYGYARDPWTATGRNALGYTSSRDQAERIAETETTRWLNWLNDPQRAEQVAQIEQWYRDRGELPPWEREYEA